MMSIISMLIIRAAHDKFLFVFKSMIIRIPTALCIPIGCALIDNVIGNLQNFSIDLVCACVEDMWFGRSHLRA